MEDVNHHPSSSSEPEGNPEQNIYINISKSLYIDNRCTRFVPKITNSHVYAFRTKTYILRMRTLEYSSTASQLDRCIFHTVLLLYQLVCILTSCSIHTLQLATTTLQRVVCIYYAYSSYQLVEQYYFQFFYYQYCMHNYTTRVRARTTLHMSCSMHGMIIILILLLGTRVVVLCIILQYAQYAYYQSSQYAYYAYIIVSIYIMNTTSSQSTQYAFELVCTHQKTLEDKNTGGQV